MNRLSPRQSAVAVERLRHASHSPDLDDHPDADLLDRFARYADHPAFESLLRRHGPMVFGVCRRLLVNPADVEDAFQATFLVLVRKARSVRRGDRLGPWLYGVAFRVASKARARAARLASRHTGTTDMLPDPSSPPEVPDWLPVLDAELGALPAKYREPLVLCELQGATRSDAAKMLGIPEGTLSSRLARGRELLRRRLLKHGTLLPAGGLAAMFTAHGVGRAAVPLGLLTKTSEAAVATGAGLAGAVPAGAALLTDEVLKGMFLTKLRTASLAVFVLGLMTAGAVAAWPAHEPSQSEKPKTAAKAADAKPQPAKAAPGVAVPDRDALQGLWVLDKVELSKGIKGDQHQELKSVIGKMHFLVAGDVWWGMLGGPGGNVFPQAAKIDATKNPKWIDLREIVPHGFSLNKCTYQLDGDRLRLCVGDGESDVRPAEFDAEADTPLIVFEFRRAPSPAVSDAAKVLEGSWNEDANPGRRGAGPPLPALAEIRGGFLFAFVPDGDGGEWIGGRYVVDDSKKPRWIDVALVAGHRDEKVAAMYGCYEVTEGGLRLALGTNGKRATRPLEFSPGKDVLYFDLKPTKAPLLAAEKVVRETAPAPKPKADPAAELERVRRHVKLGNFAAAEERLRDRLPDLTDLDAAEARLLLGVCVLERVRAADKAEAAKLLDEAWTTLADSSLGAGRYPPENAHAAWVRAQAQVRGLQVLQQQGKSDELLAAASAVLEKHRGAVEELIVLSLMYHAFKQKGEAGRAVETRDRMKAAFDKLKEKPGAFTAEKGEYSRYYWEKTWFADGK